MLVHYTSQHYLDASRSTVLAKGLEPLMGDFLCYLSIRNEPGGVYLLENRPELPQVAAQAGTGSATTLALSDVADRLLDVLAICGPGKSNAAEPAFVLAEYAALGPEQRYVLIRVSTAPFAFHQESVARGKNGRFACKPLDSDTSAWSNL